MFKISNLTAVTENKQILNEIDLHINNDEVHMLMGPNGSGKSSLALTIIGHPKYSCSSGSMIFGNQDIISLSPDKRAKLGIFLAFQYPVEIPGLNIFTFLKEAYHSLTGSIIDPDVFKNMILPLLDIVHLSVSFLNRNVNEGFSGGEKKKFEVLQLLLFKPRLAILDEIDSGLDVDSLKIVGEALSHFKKENPESSFLIITHYQHIVHYINPRFVHILNNGQLIKSGDVTLAHHIQQKGYDAFL